MSLFSYHFLHLGGNGGRGRIKLDPDGYFLAASCTLVMGLYLGSAQRRTDVIQLGWLVPQCQVFLSGAVQTPRQVRALMMSFIELFRRHPDSNPPSPDWQASVLTT